VGLVSLLFSFRGRINRLQYWTGCVVAGLAVAVVIMMMIFMAGSSLATAVNDKTGAGALGALSAIGLLFVPLSIVMGWSGLALQTKRFHDHGRSGLWCMAPYGPVSMMMVTLVGGIVAGQSPAQVGAAIQPWMTILWIMNFGFLVYLGFLPGNQGPNKYGNPAGSPSTGLQPQTATAAPAKASAAFVMGGAEQAMERAIAERTKGAQAPVVAATPRAAPAMAQARPAGPGAPATFGRRTAPR